MDSSRPPRATLRAITPPKPLETRGERTPSAGTPLASPLGFTVELKKPLVSSAAIAARLQDRNAQRFDGISRSLLLTPASGSTPTHAGSHHAPHQPHPQVMYATAGYANAPASHKSPPGAGAVPQAIDGSRPKLSFLAQQSAIRSTAAPGDKAEEDVTPTAPSHAVHQEAVSRADLAYYPPSQSHQASNSYTNTTPSGNYGQTNGSYALRPSTPPLPPQVYAPMMPAALTSTNSALYPAATAAMRRGSPSVKSSPAGSRRGSVDSTPPAGHVGLEHGIVSLQGSPLQGPTSTFLPLETHPAAVATHAAHAQAPPRGPHPPAAADVMVLISALQNRIRELESSSGLREERVRVTEHQKQSSRIVELELQVADLLQALEREKIKCAELESTFARAQRQWEGSKADWAAEKQKLMSDAEAGYNSLYSNITEKAQAVISRLREELKTALEKGESSRTQALEEAQSLVKAADSAREETVARTVHSYERMVSQLRSQLDHQTSTAAVQLETLQREVLERIRLVENERRQFQHQLEAATQIMLDEANQESYRLREEVATEKQKLRELQEQTERTIQQRCRAFETQLRARMSEAVAEARRQQAPRTTSPQTNTRKSAPVSPKPAARPTSPSVDNKYNADTVARTISDLKQFMSSVSRNGGQNGLSTASYKPGADLARGDGLIYPLSPYTTPPHSPPKGVPSNSTMPVLSSRPAMPPVMATPAIPASSFSDNFDTSMLTKDPMQAVLDLMTEEERRTWESI